MQKNKHLDLRSRVLIQNMLDLGKANLTTIAKTFGKDVSTISKEIKRYRISIPVNTAVRKKRCVKREKCLKRNVCAYCVQIDNRLCSHCIECEQNCSDFEEVCDRLKKPPYVCNGCSRFNKCGFLRFKYSADEAQKQYEKTLRESRSLICLNKASTYTEDEIITSGIRKGQSVHHIFTANKDSFSVNEKTIYNRLHQNVYSVVLANLPRTVQRKHKKEYTYKNPKDKTILESRTYIDFCNLALSNEYEVLQLDTVIGNAKGKALITMEFVHSKLFLAFLVDSKSSSNVSKVFYTIRKHLGKINVKQSDLMPVILTDNGTEFCKPTEIECDEFGIQHSKVFYCNPYASYQKGQLENNHTNLRRILPKGTSFDGLSQDQINIACSHINSVLRLSLMNKSAYEMFCFLHPNGEQILDALGIKKIKPNDVVLKPSVIKKIN